MELYLAKVQAIQAELECLDESAIKSQSIQYLMELGMRVAGFLSFTGNQMSIGKSLWRKAQAAAFERFVFSTTANGIEFTETNASKMAGRALMRDYVSAKTGQFEADYELCDRVNKCCTHINSLIITCVSALKQEWKANNSQ